VNQDDARRAAEGPDDLGSSRDMLALLLALESGDDDTMQLIKDRADHWRMLRWSLSALAAEIQGQGDDPSDWARAMIVQIVQEEAQDWAPMPPAGTGESRSPSLADAPDGKAAVPPSPGPGDGDDWQIRRPANLFARLHVLISGWTCGGLTGGSTPKRARPGTRGRRGG
jgi:hypothetical protein